MWHPEILTDPQRRLFAQAGPVADRMGFYLAGGTAVALHLGHRRSEDFDWFSLAPLRDPLAIAQTLRAAGLAFETESTAPGTLHGESQAIRLTFLQYLYPWLVEPHTYPDAGCRIASLDDLATMKLAALVQRGAKKDFIDLFALGRNHRPLPDLLALYRRRFGVEDVASLYRALAYFDDADRERTPPMLWQFDWARMKRAIREWTAELIR